MPKNLLHDRWVDTLSEQQRGARVPEIVDSHLRCLRRDQQIAKGASHVSVVQSSSNRRREYESR